MKNLSLLRVCAYSFLVLLCCVTAWLLYSSSDSGEGQQPNTVVENELKEQGNSVATDTEKLQESPEAIASGQEEQPAPEQAQKQIEQTESEEGTSQGDLAASEPEDPEQSAACALALGEATLNNAGKILDKVYTSGWVEREKALEAGLEEGVFQGTVSRGDTLTRIFSNAGVEDSGDYVKAAGQIFSPRNYRTGQPYVIAVDPQSGKLRSFEYEINDNRRLVVEGESPQARLENIEYITILVPVQGVIEDSLFQSVDDIGESPQLAMRLVDIFGSEINFIRDIQPGDSFTALIEKRYRDGVYRGYGRILGATFTCNGKKYEAYLYNSPDGKNRYFNAEGKNLNKTLLQSPLAYTRITSRFSHSRRHPLLGYSRPHLGVDYGAPTGTPVMAVGDGTVTKRGWAGGYGNQIIIAHSSGLESMYGHLSRFARGLRNGQRVRQGQVIGYVGSTGLSTGPHLDFRLRQNGRFINPAGSVNPRGAPVEARHMPRFRDLVQKVKGCLAENRHVTDYNLDSILPPASELDRLKGVSQSGNSIAIQRRKGGKARAQRRRAKN